LTGKSIRREERGEGYAEKEEVARAATIRLFNERGSGGSRQACRKNSVAGSSGSERWAADVGEKRLRAGGGGGEGGLYTVR